MPSPPIDPSDAKLCFLMKKQVSLQRGSENELLEVILLDPSDAKRCFLKKFYYEKTVFA